MPKRGTATQEQIDAMVRNTVLAADNEALDARRDGATGAEQTRQVVKCTIEFLLGNGLVEFVKTGEGEWLILNPPYTEEETTE